MTCCNFIKALPCSYSCDTIQIGVNAPTTGEYTLELQPDSIRVVRTQNTAGSPLVFPGGYLNEDATSVFKIIKPDGTYFETDDGEDCFQIEIKPTTNATLANTSVTPIACEVATAVLKNSANTTISTTEIASGASANISAPDATAVLKNTAGTTITTNPIPSNVSEDMTAPDATAVLKNTAGTTLTTEAIPSNTSEDLTAPNATMVLRNTLNTILASTGLVSGISTNVIAPDATAVVKDQHGNTLDTEAIPSNVSEDIVITLPQLLELFFAFTAGTDTSALATNTGTTWTLTALAQDGSSGTITVSINGGSYAAFSNPTSVTNGQTVQVKRTSTASAGSVTITGTYA